MLVTRSWKAIPGALARILTTPMDPDDYLELVNPLWSRHEIRARVDEVVRESSEAVTLRLTPNGLWPGHRAGQHVQLGVEIDGVREQRTFSLSSAPGEPLSLTIKRNGPGGVSDHVVKRLEPGTLVYLGEPAGDFHLPEPRPAKLLLIAGGSGITPLRSMLADLYGRGWQGDIQLIYCNRDADSTIFLRELQDLAAQWPALTLTQLYSSQGNRFSPEILEYQVPDFRERPTFLCGPSGLMEAVETLFDREKITAQLHSERFRAPERQAAGEGGRVRFADSGGEAVGSGADSVLELAEAAGLEPRHGCRMGICHTCTCTLNSGRMRNLHNGDVFDAQGYPVRICIHAPEGEVELDL